MQKKSFIIGILSGIICSTLVFTIISFAGKREIKAGSESKIVQNHVISNLSDTLSYLSFADNCLEEYSDGLDEMRNMLNTAGDSQPGRQNVTASVTAEVHTLNDILEKAEYNCQPVFFNEKGEPVREVPVTVTADRPTVKLQVSCKDFNRDVLASYQKTLTDSPADGFLTTAVADLNKITEAVSLERAKLGAYTTRLSYAKRIAAISVSDTTPEEQKESVRQVKQDIYDTLYSLCVQSSNGIYTDGDRKMMQMEYDELADELLAVSTKYGSEPAYGVSRDVVTAAGTISLLDQASAEKGMLDFASRS